MRPISQAEQQRQITSILAGWRDRGRILRYHAQTQNHVPDGGAAIRCRYTPEAAERVWDTPAATPGASIRLELGTVIGEQDRFQLEAQAGQPLPAFVKFLQIERMDYGSTCLTLHVREVAE